VNAVQFRNQREDRWRRLEQYVTSQRKIHSGESLLEFTRLYRQTASDLAYARTYFPESAITQYLNNLISVAYPRLYQRRRRTHWAVARFFGRSFPCLFRESGGYILLALLVSALGALYGFALVSHAPVRAFQLLPPAFVQQVDVSGAGPHQVVAPVMSSTIMTHNMLVALEAFVGGLTLGLFTLYALWQNGLILGVLAAMFSAGHRSTVFWSLIVPHGVTELTSIFIAGGAGLMLAHYLMDPHGMSRGRALQYGATKAGQLFLGTVPMLAVAGIIEGFLTPLAIPVSFKFATAMVTGVIWISYFAFVGRREDLPDKADATFAAPTAQRADGGSGTPPRRPPQRRQGETPQP